MEWDKKGSGETKISPRSLHIGTFWILPPIIPSKRLEVR
jgi:hypothetical protein